MFPDNVVKALENLVRAVKNEKAVEIETAIMDAIDALGYDPAEQEYLVKLEMGIISTSPDNAVREFQSIIADEPKSDWVYRVIDENGIETMVDTYRWTK